MNSMARGVEHILAATLDWATTGTTVSSILPSSTARRKKGRFHARRRVVEIGVEVGLAGLLLRSPVVVHREEDAA
jgi:hypothetical protein